MSKLDSTGTRDVASAKKKTREGTAESVEVVGESEHVDEVALVNDTVDEDESTLEADDDRISSATGTTTVTLHFDSGLALPVLVAAGGRGTASASAVVASFASASGNRRRAGGGNGGTVVVLADESVATGGVGDDVDRSLRFSALGGAAVVAPPVSPPPVLEKVKSETKSKGKGNKKKRKKAQRLAEARNAASRALAQNSRTAAGASTAQLGSWSEDVFLGFTRLAFPAAFEFAAAEKKTANAVASPIDCVDSGLVPTLTVEPTALMDPSAFLNFAESLLSEGANSGSQKDCTSSNRFHFLSGDFMKDSSNGWPKWFFELASGKKIGGDEQDRGELSQPLRLSPVLVLLARMEMSVCSAHQKFLEANNCGEMKAEAEGAVSREVIGKTETASISAHESEAIHESMLPTSGVCEEVAAEVVSSNLDPGDTFRDSLPVSNVSHAPTTPIAPPTTTTKEAGQSCSRDSVPLASIHHPDHHNDGDESSLEQWATPPEELDEEHLREHDEETLGEVCNGHHGHHDQRPPTTATPPDCTNVPVPTATSGAVAQDGSEEEIKLVNDKSKSGGEFGEHSLGNCIGSSEDPSHAVVASAYTAESPPEVVAKAVTTVTDRLRSVFSLGFDTSRVRPKSRYDVLLDLLGFFSRVRAFSNSPDVATATSSVRDIMVNSGEDRPQVAPQSANASHFNLEDVLASPLDNYISQSTSFNVAASTSETKMDAGRFLRWNELVRSALDKVGSSILRLPVSSVGEVNANSFVELADKSTSTDDLAKSIEGAKDSLALSGSRNARIASSTTSGKKKKKKKNKKKKKSTSSFVPTKAPEPELAVTADKKEATKSESAPQKEAYDGVQQKVDDVSTGNVSADDSKETNEDGQEKSDATIGTSYQGELGGKKAPEKETSSFIVKGASAMRADITVSTDGGTMVVGGSRVLQEEEHDDEGGWETVESKVARNKKSSSFASLSRKSSALSTSSFGPNRGGGDDAHSPARQRKRKDPKVRQRLKMHRSMKELVLAILDDVDTEVDRRRKHALRAINEERRKANEEKKKAQQKAAREKRIAERLGHQRIGSAGTLRPQGKSKTAALRAASLRDVVARAGPNGTMKARTPLPVRDLAHSSSMPNVVDGTDRSKRSPPSSSTPGRIKPSGVTGVMPGKVDSQATDFKSRKNMLLSSADQKTAPTVPETESGYSAGTQSNNIVAAAAETRKEPGKVTETASASMGAGAESGKEISREAKKSFRGAGKQSTPREGSSPQGRSSETQQQSSANPPLPTFLGPENTLSASSSVASSLEAPHATRLNRNNNHPHHVRQHSSSELKEDDVGYHLLRMCERLSEDMSVFMSHRAMALNARRRERGALLAALQDSVSKIWATQCHVEMYGSCATQLDLPSSDLDVVICGLDRSESAGGTTQHGQQDDSKDSHGGNNSQQEEIDDAQSAGAGESQTHEVDEASPEFSQQQYHQYQPQYQQQYQPQYQQYHGGYYPYYAPPPSPNGARVLRLAADLEHQPWAVQVKAIPTASVPVIKVLADPSRIPGAGAVDWVQVQQQQMAAAQVAVAQVAHVSPGGEAMVEERPELEHQQSGGMSCPPTVERQQSGSAALSPSTPISAPVEQQHTGGQPQPQYFTVDAATGQMIPASPPQQFFHQASFGHHVAQAMPPWRGADVLNGLISVDITFEGPEHGGIGSTAFSAGIVQDACDETGLLPEGTPVVQAIMVIKEMLAQRRLNEPFSGGLSSYALLLLVVAVMNERKIIREEMDRIDRQKRAVAAEAESNAAATSVASRSRAQSNTEQSHQHVAVAVRQKSSQEAVADAPATEEEGTVWQRSMKISGGKEGVSTSAPASMPSSAPSSVSSTAATTATEKAASSQRKSMQKSQKGHQPMQPEHPKSQKASQVKAETGKPAVPPLSSANASAAVAAKPVTANAPTSFRDALASSASKKSSAPTVPARTSTVAPTPAPAKKSSWAAIAKKKSTPAPPARPPAMKTGNVREQGKQTVQKQATAASVVPQNAEPRVNPSGQQASPGKMQDRSHQPEKKSVSDDSKSVSHQPDSAAVATTSALTPSTGSNAIAGPSTPDAPAGGTNAGKQGSSPATPLFPQGSNDVLEVLCSGEPTAGKILMHFMLFYGQHYDSQSTSIDVRGTHHPDYYKELRSEQRHQRDEHSHRQRHHHSVQDQIEYQSNCLQPALLSPFIPRKAGGSIDPISGMYTVDPIVIYDPLEGAESNNVAKSCFAWGTIRNVFAQCYMTLSGAVERGVSSSTLPSGRAASSSGCGVTDITRSKVGQNDQGIRNAAIAASPSKGDNAHHEVVDISSQEQREGDGKEGKETPSAKERASSTAVDGGSSFLALLLSF
uniref:Polymerase nucleotidyl transferase domain-containing protein n=1 Tax=Odontella aurita TaxID=265563 RepID=A0A7S4K8F7_9STRA